MSQRPLDNTKCAVCRDVPVKGKYDLCDSCFSEWKRQKRAPGELPLCARCKKNRTESESRDQCPSCYQEWKHATGAPDTRFFGTGGFSAMGGSFGGSGVGGGSSFGRAPSPPPVKKDPFNDNKGGMPPPGRKEPFDDRDGMPPPERKDNYSDKWGGMPPPGRKEPFDDNRGGMPSGGKREPFPASSGAMPSPPKDDKKDDVKKNCCACYSISYSDLTGYLFVSATFSYRNFKPATLHFFVPDDAMGLDILERFSTEFLQRKLVLIDERTSEVNLITSSLNMDFDLFLKSDEIGRRKAFENFVRNMN